MHAGQQNEYPESGNTFFSNESGLVPDLTPGDLDIIQHVNNVFARDAEKKRLLNGGAAYVLRP